MKQTNKYLFILMMALTSLNATEALSNPELLAAVQSMHVDCPGFKNLDDQERIEAIVNSLYKQSENFYDGKISQNFFASGVVEFFENVSDVKLCQTFAKKIAEHAERQNKTHDVRSAIDSASKLFDETSIQKKLNWLSQAVGAPKGTRDSVIRAVPQTKVAVPNDKASLNVFGTTQQKQPLKITMKKPEQGQKPVEVKVKKPEQGQQLAEVKVKEPKQGQQLAEVKVKEPKQGQQLAEVKVKEPKQGQQLAEVKVKEPKQGQQLLKVKVKKPVIWMSAEETQQMKQIMSKLPRSQEDFIKLAQDDIETIENSLDTPEKKAESFLGHIHLSGGSPQIYYAPFFRTLKAFDTDKKRLEHFQDFCRTKPLQEFITEEIVNQIKDFVRTSESAVLWMNETLSLLGGIKAAHFLIDSLESEAVLSDTDRSTMIGKAADLIAERNIQNEDVTALFNRFQRSAAICLNNKKRLIKDLCFEYRNNNYFQIREQADYVINLVAQTLNAQEKCDWYKEILTSIPNAEDVRDRFYTFFPALMAQENDLAPAIALINTLFGEKKVDDAVCLMRSVINAENFQNSFGIISGVMRQMLQSTATNDSIIEILDIVCRHRSDNEQVNNDKAAIVRAASQRIIGSPVIAQALIPIMPASLLNEMLIHSRLNEENHAANDNLVQALTAALNQENAGNLNLLNTVNLFMDQIVESQDAMNALVQPMLTYFQRNGTVDNADLLFGQFSRMLRAAPANAPLARVLTVENINALTASVVATLTASNPELTIENIETYALAVMGFVREYMNVEGVPNAQEHRIAEIVQASGLLSPAFQHLNVGSWCAGFLIDGAQTEHHGNLIGLRYKNMTEINFLGDDVKGMLRNAAGKRDFLVGFLNTCWEFLTDANNVRANNVRNKARFLQSVGEELETVGFADVFNVLAEPLKNQLRLYFPAFRDPNGLQIVLQDSFDDYVRTIASWDHQRNLDHVDISGLNATQVENLFKDLGRQNQHMCLNLLINQYNRIFGDQNINLQLRSSVAKMYFRWQLERNDQNAEPALIPANCNTEEVRAIIEDLEGCVNYHGNVYINAFGRFIAAQYNQVITNQAIPEAVRLLVAERYFRHQVLVIEAENVNLNERGLHTRQLLLENQNPDNDYLKIYAFAQIGAQYGQAQACAAYGDFLLSSRRIENAEYWSVALNKIRTLEKLEELPRTDRAAEILNHCQNTAVAQLSGCDRMFAAARRLRKFCEGYENQNARRRDVFYYLELLSTPEQRLDVLTKGEIFRQQQGAVLPQPGNVANSIFGPQDQYWNNVFFLADFMNAAMGPNPFAVWIEQRILSWNAFHAADENQQIILQNGNINFADQLKAVATLDDEAFNAFYRESFPNQGNNNLTEILRTIYNNKKDNDTLFYYANEMMVYGEQKVVARRARVEDSIAELSKFYGINPQNVNPEAIERLRAETNQNMQNARKTVFFHIKTSFPGINTGSAADAQQLLAGHPHIREHLRPGVLGIPVRPLPGNMIPPVGVDSYLN